MKSKTNKQANKKTNSIKLANNIKTVNPDLHLKPQAMHKRERANK